MSSVKKGTPYWALNFLLGFPRQEPLGETDKNCLLLNKKEFYYFSDARCNSNHGVICEPKS